MSREVFKSHLGFLLVSAGCAIGIGNVWKFPYVAGQNGGGIFVFFYIIFLLIIGIPVLTMELAIGRASRKSTVLAYKSLEKKEQFWHIHGWVGIIGCFILMSYYTIVSGWMVGYFYKFVSGKFDKIEINKSEELFAQMLSDPAEMLAWLVITLIIGFAMCGCGLQKGIERISKYMMVGMFVLIVVLVLNSFMLNKAFEGLAFFLMPDFERMNEAGIFNVITDAMNQAFFTLGIGLASMEIFGSYMTKDNTLVSESVRICLLDTVVAISSGLIIFPACYSFGVEPDTGTSLIFVTLPKVFANMTCGKLFGSLFFLFMSFASLTTVIAVFENLVANVSDNFKIQRNKAILILAVIIFISAIPSLLGYNILIEVTPIATLNILESADYAVSNLLLPTGALVYILFCVSKWGWGFDNYIKEVNTGRGIKLSQKIKPYFQFVLPLLIILIFISGLR